MLKINRTNKEINGRVLEHSDRVFHEALSYVKGGERYFHVLEQGKEAYDLEYYDNRKVSERDYGSMGETFFGDYFDYDEDRTDDLYLDALREHPAFFFREVSEYSVVLTKLLLKHSEGTVYFEDELIRLFVGENDRLVIGNPSGGDVLSVSLDYPGDPSWSESRNNIVNVFHDVFFCEALSRNKPLGEVKGFLLRLGKEEGVGSILRMYYALSYTLADRQIPVYLDYRSTRYSKEIWQKYTSMELCESEETESGTEVIENFYLLLSLHALQVYGRRIDTSIFNPAFLAQAEEYRLAVFKDRKPIGVLLRGTDYITTGIGMGGPMRQAPMDRVIERLKTMLEGDAYDCIFLATEDKDILGKMRGTFGDKLYALSQIRHSVNEFQGEKYLDDLDRNSLSQEDYERNLDDTTANYLYALYILSRCEAYVCAGITSAFDLIVPMNRNCFRECIIVR